MRLLEMTDRSNHILCSDITKFSELLTGPIPEYIYIIYIYIGYKLNIVGATLTLTVNISSL